MNRTNKLTAVLTSAVLALALSAQAEVGMINFGITNAIGVNATTSVNLGNAVKIDNQDNCGIMLKFQGNAAGTEQILVTLKRSPDNVNWETLPTITGISAVLNGTTAVVAYTNLPAAVVGAAGYLKVSSIVNASATAGATNASLYLVKKTVKAAP
jgi:hypothetical protein